MKQRQFPRPAGLAGAARTAFLGVITMIILVLAPWHECPAAESVDIRPFLNPDGTANMNLLAASNLAGAIDLSQVEVSIDQVSGAPRFLPKGNALEPLVVQEWKTGFGMPTRLSESSTSGPDGGYVDAVCVFDSKLIVGGHFAGPFDYIASWDGTTWSRFGGLMSPVTSLAEFNGNLYAGLEENNTGTEILKKWNGSIWVNVGFGFEVGKTVLSMTSYLGKLYLAGTFTSAGAVSASHIASYDGSTFSALPSGGTDGTQVSALCVVGSLLYLTGDFDNAGNIAAARIASFNGATGTWSALGSGLQRNQPGTNTAIGLALLASGSDLIVGGAFTHAGGTSALNIARWNGSTWATLGGGLGLTSTDCDCADPSGEVKALAKYSYTLYGTAVTQIVAGGSFTNLENICASYVNKLAAIDATPNQGGGISYGSQWQSVYGSGQGDGVENGVVFALGNFTVGSIPRLVVAGSFSKAGGRAAERTMLWSCSNNAFHWDHLGSGVGDLQYLSGSYSISGAIEAIAVYAGKIFIGGDFTVAGGVAAGVAQWDGTTWQTIERGLVGTGSARPKVYAMTAYSGGLLIGGAFSGATIQDPAQGSTTCDLVTLDSQNLLFYKTGAGWQAPALPSLQVPGEVRALSSYSTATATRVAVGGTFYNSSGANSAVKRVFWVNQDALLGTWTWGSLGQGFADGTVRALRSQNGNLYAGGDFLTAAAGQSRKRVAKYNASTNQWDAMGSGIDDGTVYALGAGLGASDLLVGGRFNKINNVTYNNLGVWNTATSAWSSFGTGPGVGGASTVVKSLGIFKGKVVVGGQTLFSSGNDCLATWSGSAWTALGGGAQGTKKVNAIAVNGSNELWIGGTFTSVGAGNTPSYEIALWTDTSAGKVEDPAGETPANLTGGALILAVQPASPNPFRLQTSIRFALNHAEHVSVRVFDISGRIIRNLVTSELQPGAYQVEWDGRDSSGQRAAAGVYFVNFRAGGEFKTSRVILSR